MKSRFHLLTRSKPAYPPVVNARSKFMVAADWLYACTRRLGSGMRASAVNSGPLMMSPLYDGRDTPSCICKCEYECHRVGLGCHLEGKLKPCALREHPGHQGFNQLGQGHGTRTMSSMSAERGFANWPAMRPIFTTGMPPPNIMTTDICRSTL